MLQGKLQQIKAIAQLIGIRTQIPPAVLHVWSQQKWKKAVKI